MRLTAPQGNSFASRANSLYSPPMAYRGCLLYTSGMITHVGGLNSVAETTLNLPKIPGGKKLVYTHIDMPMTAISDFADKGKDDPMFAALAEICDRHNGLWLSLIHI